MNFSDIELRLRYPEVFRRVDAMAPPIRADLPAPVRTARPGVWLWHRFSARFL